MQTCLYQVTRRETGDKYIGISKKPLVRWHQHESAANNGSKVRFHRALAKYGFNAFDWEIKAVLPSSEEAQIAERIAIATQKPVYNLTAGGEGTVGYIPSAETRAKLSERRRGVKREAFSLEHRHNLRMAQLGKKMSEAHREASRKASLGRKHTEETKATIGAAHRGKIVSSETRKKLSEAAKNRPAKKLAKMTAQRVVDSGVSL